MDLFLAHSLALFWISVATARRLLSHPSDRLLAAALLAWANLVTTRWLLTVVDRLGETTWVFAASLGLATLLAGIVSCLRPNAPPAEATLPGPGLGPMLAAGVALLPLAPGQLFTGYLDQPGDPEVLNATAWLLSGFALYRLGRICALGANTALGLSWLGMAAGLLAVPLGLDLRALPALTGTLISLVFALQKGPDHRRHALLATLAALLVIGGLPGYLGPNLHWSGPPSPKPAIPSLPPDPQRIFLQDLVHAPQTGPVLTEGLRPAEGPFPLRDLPRFRSVRQPSLRLTLPVQPGLARLRLRYSLGLVQRDKTEITVLWNGRTVQQLTVNRRHGWIDATLELDARAGENVLEFADVPHQQELDWFGYLERYADVRRHLVTHNIPAEQGALEHYEFSGRPEGRIMLKREIPPPVRGAYYFVFRELHVEGRQ